MGLLRLGENARIGFQPMRDGSSRVQEAGRGGFRRGAGEQASRRAGTAHRSRLVCRSRSPARLLARPPHGVYNSAGFGTSCASSPPTATRNGFPFQVIATMSEWGYVGLAFRVHTLVAGSYEKASHSSPRL